MGRWSTTVVVAAVLALRAVPVQAPTTTSERPPCDVVAGVEVGCEPDDGASGDNALPWLVFGLVLLPVAFIAVAGIVVVPVLAALGALRRRWARRRRAS